jgi:hypothetical protein
MIENAAINQPIIQVEWDMAPPKYIRAIEGCDAPRYRDSRQRRTKCLAHQREVWREENHRRLTRLYEYRAMYYELLNELEEMSVEMARIERKSEN